VSGSVSTPPPLRPVFFGPPDSPLFGCHHAPPLQSRGAGGVLVCQPVGHEYFACHRAVRQLAIRLSQSGRAVLRFDFYGSGDSAGEAAAGLPSRWIDDISSGVAELGAQSAGVSLVGLRLGATLALLRQQRGECADNLVVWDPVVDGRRYVAEMLALHRKRFGRTTTDEALGYPLPPSVRAELEQIDLLKTEAPRARRLLLVETGAPREETRALEQRLRDRGAAVEYRAFAGPAIWQDQPSQPPVPAAVIQFIVSWMRSA